MNCLDVESSCVELFVSVFPTSPEARYAGLVIDLVFATKAVLSNGTFAPLA